MLCIEFSQVYTRSSHALHVSGCVSDDIWHRFAEKSGVTDIVDVWKTIRYCKDSFSFATTTGPQKKVEGSDNRGHRRKREQCIVQRSAKKFVRGCERFIRALAYLICLALPGSCLARFSYFLADLCIFLTNQAE